jgi:DNA-binding CsgD family transcriptional regulator
MSKETLTNRQKQILILVTKGMTSKQIAKQLALSPKTVDAHRANIMDRLKIDNIAGLIKYAVREGLISLERNQRTVYSKRVNKEVQENKTDNHQQAS